mmetsp:Transcript_23618/g.59792  ORF Transcript_23618/g.59792 Transcript_23618/m.59792 type:complete len:543 (-) Transcript_23618:72-1700(-)
MALLSRARDFRVLSLAIAPGRVAIWLLSTQSAVRAVRPPTSSGSTRRALRLSTRALRVGARRGQGIMIVSSCSPASSTWPWLVPLPTLRRNERMALTPCRWISWGGQSSPSLLVTLSTSSCVMWPISGAICCSLLSISERDLRRVSSAMDAGTWERRLSLREREAREPRAVRVSGRAIRQLPVKLSAVSICIWSTLAGMNQSAITDRSRLPVALQARRRWRYSRHFFRPKDMTSRGMSSVDVCTAPSGRVTTCSVSSLSSLRPPHPCMKLQGKDSKGLASSVTVSSLLRLANESGSLVRLLLSACSSVSLVSAPMASGSAARLLYDTSSVVSATICPMVGGSSVMSLYARWRVSMRSHPMKTSTGKVLRPRRDRLTAPYTMPICTSRRYPIRRDTLSLSIMVATSLMPSLSLTSRNTRPTMLARSQGSTFIWLRVAVRTWRRAMLQMFVLNSLKRLPSMCSVCKELQSPSSTGTSDSSLSLRLSNWRSLRRQMLRGSCAMPLSDTSSSTMLGDTRSWSGTSSILCPANLPLPVVTASSRADR